MGDRAMQFWLRAETARSRLRAPRRVCLWLLMRAAAAVRYEPLRADSERDSRPW